MILYNFINYINCILYFILFDNSFIIYLIKINLLALYRMKDFMGKI